MAHHTSDIGGRIRWTAIAAAAVVTLGVGGLVAAGSDGSPELRPSPTVQPAVALRTHPYTACLRTGSATTDRIEARVDHCRRWTAELYADPNFIACLRGAAGTPDSIQRWLEPCRIATRG